MDSIVTLTSVLSHRVSIRERKEKMAFKLRKSAGRAGSG
jgi:hypothetical protein